MLDTAAEKFLQITNSLQVILSRSVVWIFCSNSNDHGRTLYSIGSGFIVGYSGNCYLVTALHVFEESKKYDVACLSICGNSTAFASLVGIMDDNNDLIIFSLPQEWLMDNNVETQYVFNLNALNNCCTGFNSFMLLGFPGGQNKIYGKVPEAPRDHKILCITAEMTEEIITSSEIESHIAFKYDAKRILNSELKPYGITPDLHGMSGGPAVELVVTSEKGLDIRLAGVLARWHRSEQRIIAIQSGRILDLISIISLTPNCHNIAI